ncbi:MAG: TetR family transcriptional regulator [Myxococcales bacterium FL481]|nr:MAG: TetR family transcriptional regulator [Myxococcales bacterium FL481]
MSANKKGDDARVRLVQAAIATIADRGWPGATTRAIAEAADANLALVNYYFGSKQTLLLTALETSMRELADAFNLDGLAHDPARVLEACLRLVEQQPPDARLRVLFEGTMQARHDESIRRVTANMLAGYRTSLASALAQGHPPSPRHRGRAAALVAILDGLLLHKLVDPELDPALARESLQCLASRELD